MEPLVLLLAVAHSSLASASVSGQAVWMEEPILMQMKGYHPEVRFYGESKFLFKTPNTMVNGHFASDGPKVSFRPETAIELNHADVDKLVEGEAPEQKARDIKGYETALITFEATFSDDRQSLSLTYFVKGVQRSYTLHPFNYGDDKLASSVGQAEASLVGIWNGPEPFPDRLDSKTRYRIENMDGLRKFASEAMASDANQFNLIDLRVDSTFRLGRDTGRWFRQGDVLHVKPDGKPEMIFTVVENKSLNSAGRKLFVRD